MYSTVSLRSAVSGCPVALSVTVRSIGVMAGLIRAEEPRLVRHDRTADRAGGFVPVVRVVLILHVLGLVLVGQADPERRCAGVRAVGGTERGRLAAGRAGPLPVEQPVAVIGVGAALGDRVDHAAGGAAVFSGVAAGLYLHFIDEIDDDVLAGEAALQVGRLDAVDDVAVLAGARAVDGEAAKLHFIVRARRLRDERREIAAVRPSPHLRLSHAVLVQQLATPAAPQPTTRRVYVHTHW